MPTTLPFTTYSGLSESILNLYRSTPIYVQITDVPVASITDLITFNANVVGITVTDINSEFDFELVNSFSAFINGLNITDLHVTVSQLRQYKSLCLLNASPISLTDPENLTFTDYAIILAEFPTMVYETSEFLVPTPALSFSSSTDTSITMTISTSGNAAYNEYSLVLKTDSEDIGLEATGSYTVRNLNPGTKYNYRLAVVGGTNFTITSNNVVMATSLVLTQNRNVLSFTTSQTLTSPTLRDSLGNSLSLSVSTEGFSCTMPDSSFVGVTKNFVLYDTVAVFSFLPITIKKFDVPTPNFHFENVTYTSMTLVFDNSDDSLNDTYTLTISDDATGIPLFSNIASSTSFVELTNYAAGQPVSIQVSAIGTSGYERQTLKTQSTLPIGNFSITQNGSLLTFGWGGSLVNHYITLNDRTLTTTYTYEMPDSSLVNAPVTFYLKGETYTEVSLPFNSFTVQPFQLPTVSYLCATTLTSASITTTIVDKNNYLPFTYTVTDGNVSYYSDLDSNTSTMIVTPETFVSTIYVSIEGNGMTTTTPLNPIFIPVPQLVYNSNTLSDSSILSTVFNNGDLTFSVNGNSAELPYQPNLNDTCRLTSGSQTFTAVYTDSETALTLTQRDLFIVSQFTYDEFIAFNFVSRLATPYTVTGVNAGLADDILQNLGTFVTVVDSSTQIELYAADLATDHARITSITTNDSMILTFTIQEYIATSNVIAFLSKVIISDTVANLSQNLSLYSSKILSIQPILPDPTYPIEISSSVFLSNVSGMLLYPANSFNVTATAYDFHSSPTSFNALSVNRLVIVDTALYLQGYIASLNSSLIYSITNSEGVIALTVSEYLNNSTAVSLFNTPVTVNDTASVIVENYNSIQHLTIISDAPYLVPTPSIHFSNITSIGFTVDATLPSGEYDSYTTNITCNDSVYTAFPFTVATLQFDTSYDVVAVLTGETYGFQTTVTATTKTLNASMYVDQTGDTLNFIVQGIFIAPVIKDQRGNVIASGSPLRYKMTDVRYVNIAETFTLYEEALSIISYTFTTAPFTLISNICFPKNTKVYCDQGCFSIQDLKKTNTFGGYAVVTVTETVSLDDDLVEFAPFSLSETVPTSTLRISRDHAILHNDKFIKAKDLKEGKLVPYSGETLYNVLLEVHGIMNVQGVACETLHPMNSVALFYRTGQTDTVAWNKLALKVF